MGKRLFLPVSLFLLAGACLSGQSTFSSLPQWNGTTFISSFGVTNTATYGQTITVTSGFGNLLGFSFQIGNCSADVTFRGHVYAWDGSKATGAALFNSAPQTVTASATYTQVTFNTGTLALPLGQYVLFASTSEDQGGAPTSACRWGSLTNNTFYPGGQFVFINNGPDPTQWTANNWSNIGQDLAFTISIDGSLYSVPTLSEWGMILLAGLLVGGGFLMLRSRSNLAPSTE